MFEGFNRGSGNRVNFEMALENGSNTATSTSGTGSINVFVSRGGGLVEGEVVEMVVPGFSNAEEVQVVIRDEVVQN